MVDVQTISVVIASISVVIGMIIGVEQLRDLKNTRQTEMAMQFYSVFVKREFLRNVSDVLYSQDFTTVREWVEKYGPQVNPEAATQLYSIIFTINTIGALFKERILDPNLLFQIWHPLAILGLWEKLKPLIHGWRESYIFPELWEPFEYLANETKKRYPQIRITD